MDLAVWLVIAVMGAVCVMLMLAGRWAETRYYRSHPPDDGTREERFDDDDD